MLAQRSDNGATAAIGRALRSGAGVGAVITTVLVVVILVGIALWNSAFVVTSPPTSPESSDQGDQLRWESFRGIELRVPAAWGHGVREGSWCAGDAASQAAPPGAVGRPGIEPAIMCGSPHPPPHQRNPWVLFGRGDRAAGVEEFDGGWRKETRRIGPVSVTIFADDDQLRARIFDSARIVTTTDSAGCHPGHAVVVGRTFRPSTGATLPSPADVSSVSVCRYERSASRRIPPPLLSSSRLTGTEAARLVEAVRAAPHGEGPNSARQCAGGHSYGDELIVLRARAQHGVREVLVRYSGCAGNRIDDGETTRQLTADVLQLLLTEPHRPSSLHGPVARLVW